MFITDHLTPAETMSELLNLKGYNKTDTGRFRKLRHNDHLCPGFRERSSAVLDAYKSHRTDVYDIQGPRDEGVDVLLTYEDNGRHRLGLQIKSFHEIEAWRLKQDKGFVQRLKAQHWAATQNLKVEDYYIVLCTDEREHKDQIRLICSEFKQSNRIKIVLPRTALAFFDLSDMEVQARVTRLLCQQDTILEAAVRVVEEMPPDRAFLLIALVCRAFEAGLHVSPETLHGIYANWQDIDRKAAPKGDRLGELVWELDSFGLSTTDEGFKIEIPQLPTSLCAMYFDLKLRQSGDVALGLATLLGLASGRPARRWREGSRSRSMGGASG
jgi:hypothetical protein